MKPLKDWTFFDAVFYLICIIVLAYVASVLLTVVGTLAGVILGFAGTGVGAIVIALVCFHYWKKWTTKSDKTEETE